MTPSPENEAKLERFVRQATGDLPARRAPRSLERRVLAELERRAALPWWRKSFFHWPMAARAGFVFASAGLANVLVMLGMWGAAGFEAARFREIFATHFAWLESALTVKHALAGFLDIMSRNIPPVWLYGGLAFFGLMYLTLFGLGAAAYRALHAQR